MGRRVFCIRIHVNGRFAPFFSRHGGGKWSFERGTKNFWVVVIQVGERLIQQSH